MQQISTPPQLVPDPVKPSWLARLYQRASWAVKAFNATSLSPVIALENGLLFDPTRNLLIINGDCQIHSTGSMRISARKHVILQSGQDDEGDRPGYLNSIWFNPELDDENRPIDLDADIEPGVKL